MLTQHVHREDVSLEEVKGITNQMTTQNVSELRIVEKPAFKVVGMLHRGQPMSPEIPKVWDRFGPRMDSVPNSINPAVSYGVCKDMDMESGLFDYMACVEVKNTDNVPADMVAAEIPAATYAVFPATLTNLGEVFMQAEAAITAAGRQPVMLPQLEVYDEKFDPRVDGSIVYVYIPIEK